MVSGEKNSCQSLAVFKNQDIVYKDPIDNRIYRGTLSSMILALLCLLISGFFSDLMVQIEEFKKINTPQPTHHRRFLTLIL